MDSFLFQIGQKLILQKCYGKFIYIQKFHILPGLVEIILLGAKTQSFIMLSVLRAAPVQILNCVYESLE